MAIPRALCAALLTTLLAPAQTVEVVGGTTTPATRTNSAKASLYRVDTSVLLIDFEMWLDVPGPETLTFFSHRHHSRSGVATLEWTHPVQVAGGGGPQWYSTGPIALPLVAGNHYTLGVSWPGSLTYYYRIGTTGSAVSFGSWQRAHTLTNPLPPTLTIPTGVDSAQYHQRLTTVTLGLPANVGSGCTTGAAAPRLVATGTFPPGSNEGFELVGALPGAVGAFVFALGPTLATPVPLFGCDVWVDLGTSASVLAVTSATGYALQPFPVPNDPALVGTDFSVQAGVLGTGLDLSNAVGFQIG